jgi:2-oxoglutarate ferredoxin oxidoreductase subunit beta
VALGVIRSVVEPSYERDYQQQIEEVQMRTPKKSFTEFLLDSSNVWEVK